MLRKIINTIIGFITIGWIIYIADIVNNSSVGILGRGFIKLWLAVLIIVWLGHMGKNK